MNRYLLDTHVWIWFQRGDAVQIRPEFQQQLSVWQDQELLYVSPISAWELGLLIASSYLDLGTSIDNFVETAITECGLQLVPLTPGILIESTRLPGNLHRDPADRILAATARAQGLTLLTRDKALLRYGKAGHLSVRKP